MRSKIEWRRHPQHGHMLRGIPRESPGYGVWCTVVTSLLRDNLSTEIDPALWANQALRLHVNAGCGQIACDEMRENDVNPDFVVVRASSVPKHIREAFLAYIADEVAP